MKNEEQNKIEQLCSYIEKLKKDNSDLQKKFESLLNDYEWQKNALHQAHNENALLRGNSIFLRDEAIDRLVYSAYNSDNEKFIILESTDTTKLYVLEATGEYVTVVEKAKTSKGEYSAIVGYYCLKISMIQYIKYSNK